MLFALGCEQSKLKKVAQAADGFSLAVKAFQEAEIAAHQQGFVDDQEHHEIQAALADVARAGLELDSDIRAARDVRTARGAMGQVWTSVDNLYTGGVLHIKNPKARQDLEALLLAAKGFLATISAVLG
jgi:hypothetical protein